MNQSENLEEVKLVVEPLRVGTLAAARLLGIGRTRLYVHIRSGRIRTVKDGDRVLITMAELRDFVARGTEDSAA